jgi:hypothetical protein
MDVIPVSLIQLLLNYNGSMDPGGGARGERYVLSPVRTEAEDIQPRLDIARQTREFIFHRWFVARGECEFHLKSR